MRLSLTILVALAIVGAHIQRVSAQDKNGTSPASPTPSATPSSGVAIPPPSDTPMPSSKNSDSLVATGGMAYASNNNNFFIHGGVKQDRKNSTQFYSLDLTSDWSAESPAWTALPIGNFTSYSGGFTPEGKFFVTGAAEGGITAMFLYNPPQWDQGNGSEALSGNGGPFLATDPDQTTYYVDSDNAIRSLPFSNVSGIRTKISLGSGMTVRALSWSTSQEKLVFTYTRGGGELQFGQASPGAANAEPIRGVNLTARRDHCLVPNQNGTVFYIFGGIVGQQPSTDVLSLDMNTLNLTTVTPQNEPFSPSVARSKMACAVKGNTLIIWGGFTDTNQTRVADATPLLFDTSSNTWINSFKIVNNGTDGNPDGLPPVPSGDDSKNSNLGAIIGGAVGGLAFIAFVAGFFVFRRRKAQKKSSNQTLSRSGPSASGAGEGKSADGQVNVPMDEYITIRSPFVADDTSIYRGSTAAPPSYAAPGPHPVSAPLMNQNGTILSQPVQPYSMPFQAPPIPVRPMSSAPQPPLIRSPFETETETSAHHPLLSLPSAPVSGDLGGLAPGPYRGRDGYDDSDGRSGGVGTFSPSMEPATVDLIPVTTSDGGDHSRSNSLISSRSGPGRSGTMKTKARSQAKTTTTLLDDEADDRRNSTDTLDFLEIS